MLPLEEVQRDATYREAVINRLLATITELRASTDPIAPIILDSFETRFGALSECDYTKKSRTYFEHLDRWLSGIGPYLGQGATIWYRDDTSPQPVTVIEIIQTRKRLAVRADIIVAPDMFLPNPDGQITQFTLRVNRRWLPVGVSMIEPVPSWLELGRRIDVTH